LFYLHSTGITSYRIGSPSQDNAKLYSPFYLLNPSQGVDHAIAFNGVPGNPPISFDLSIEAKPNVMFELSSIKASPVDTAYFQDDSVTLQEIILTRALTDSPCAALAEPGNPINPVFALYGGNYFIHDPRFVSSRRLLFASSQNCIVLIASF
jgi:hypothetical protein